MATNVLIVEDSEDQREAYATYLTNQGLTVALAADGRQGLAKAFQAGPDVVLLDLSLPEISGWEVARQIRANEKTRHIPIIALTAHFLATAEALGCEGCLSNRVRPRMYGQKFFELFPTCVAHSQPRLQTKL